MFFIVEYVHSFYFFIVIAFIAIFKIKRHIKFRSYSTHVQLVLSEAFHCSCTGLMEATDQVYSVAAAGEI